MKRKHKTYSKPKRPFDKQRLEEEAEIKKQFGLKNKKEIWKVESKIASIREKAKKLISATEAEQKILFDQLNKIGLKVESISDILGLDKKSYMNRRLQTIVLNKGIANSAKHARQLITHKKILVNEKVVSTPSYIVPVELEDKIELKKKIKKEKKVEASASPAPTPTQENSEKKSEEGNENEKKSGPQNETENKLEGEEKSEKGEDEK